MIDLNNNKLLDLCEKKLFYYENVVKRLKMKKLSVKLSIPAILLLSASYMQGQTIKEVVEHTMSTNPKVMSTLKNNDAFRLYIDEAKGGYYPKVDLTAYVGAKITKTDPDAGNNTRTDEEGYNVQLDFEQLIYDFGQTGGQIDEAQYRYTSNKYLNQSIVDDIIYDSVDSYLNLVKYKNRLDISETGLKIYNDYLVTAKETEEISGEALQKAQVNAKIHFANNTMYEDRINNLRAVSSFKKNVGIDPDGKSCRPNLDDSKMPTTLKALIEQVIVSNPLILEQVENIKEQRAILNQRDSNLYPTIKFKAQASQDKDLTTAREITDIYSARIELSWNIFNGGKDRKSTLREKTFLDEAQKTLDTVTKDVVDLVTAAYNKYNYSKKRIAELEMYIKDNEDILAIYKDQFEGGTRTFIDVLNIERDLISAKKDLIDVQYDLDSAYFEIHNHLGSLKESILSSNNNVCTETKPMPMEEKVEEKTKDTSSEELQSLLSEEKPAETTMEEMKPGTYAVYFVAYKELASTEKAIEAMKEVIGAEYQMKAEAARGLQSAVIYNLESMEVANEVKAKVVKIYSDAYIRKIK